MWDRRFVSWKVTSQSLSGGSSMVGNGADEMMSGLEVQGSRLLSVREGL
jgi:hypothetical protein